jgi:hypothetical protein
VGGHALKIQRKIGGEVPNYVLHLQSMILFVKYDYKDLFSKILVVIYNSATGLKHPMGPSGPFSLFRKKEI